jgi:hypothetical protein
VVVVSVVRISWSSIIGSLPGRRRNCETGIDRKPSSKSEFSGTDVNHGPRLDADAQTGANIRRVVITICVLFWALAIYLFLKSRGV